MTNPAVPPSAADDQVHFVFGLSLTRNPLTKSITIVGLVTVRHSAMPLSFRKLFQMGKPSSHWSEYGSHDQPGSASRRCRRSGSFRACFFVFRPSFRADNHRRSYDLWHSAMSLPFGKLFQMSEALLPLIVNGHPMTNPAVLLSVADDQVNCFFSSSLNRYPLTEPITVIGLVS